MSMPDRFERTSRRSFLAATACVALSAATGSARAAQWPTRPIRVISPYPAGSASDTVTRVVLDQASQIVGQPFVIEIRPGAGGAIGFASVAHSPPDGYTLVTSSSSMATETVLHSKLAYDPHRDFAPVVLIGTSPNVLVASKKSGFKSVADLVAAAKEKPDTLTFASAGIGSSSHMAAEKFRLAAKIQVRHVPFKEGGLVQVMAGTIDFYFLPLAAAASALNNPNLTVLLVSSPKRSPRIPDIPSVVDAGLPDAVFRFWNGLSAPAKTPTDVIQALHDGTQKAIDNAAVQEKLAQLGVEPARMSVADFQKFFEEDFAATTQLAKAAGISAVD
jgi:tripartite-type tricarboxylate transporter receptor subunit TctC